MSEIRLNIDGRELLGYEGQTVLEIARENGIEIPTLCHDERVKMYGSCGVCVVEAEGSPRLMRSCSTYAANGMIISTNTPRVRSSRKTALELLLSDHTGDCRPPCVLACPAQTDCQGYVGLIANGEYEEALKLVKDKIPLPAAIGRVCPHPCETACRRELVEEPVSIAALKQFVGDLDLNKDGKAYTIPVGEPTGKRVAIIGGGPGGLTAAYFLRGEGHEVTVFDAMPHMGGMLRYGIPEYRLPKRLLQEEIDAIEGMGVEFKNNVKIGSDIKMDYLRRMYDAVIVAVGAWSSSGMRCKGENLEGVLGGIDFLRDVALNNPVFTGRKIAVVGGGNTAMDACRTAIRLGAEKVYNIYRRTKNEMPAEEIEIIEAEEEGVVFKNLTNPNEVEGENGKVKAVRLQIMELGEPDASGRRAPVAVEGKEETIEVDTVVVAIGQKLNPMGFEDIELTKWGTISADENTCRTSIEGVFAIGDATNKGADIAIAAIGEAKKAAVMVDKYLNGEELSYEATYLVKSEKTAEDFADKEKQPRAKMPHRCAAERKDDFLEINHGLSEEEAKREANRCLECGCHDYFECKLIDYANQYKVQPEKYDGIVHHRTQPDTHPFIHRNPDKCILCGLCVRICDEVVGATALGLVDRGFNTIVKPALDIDLRDTDCISCGQCVNVCPTGALTESMQIAKQVPVREQSHETVCSFCSVGCKQKLTSNGDMLIRSIPTAEREQDALLCMKGRFGFGEIARKERLTAPLIKRESGFVKATLEQAVVYANKSLQSLQTQFGNDCIAVAISDRYTNEEALAIKNYANNALHTNNVFSFARTESGLAEVIGVDASTASLEELNGTELIILTGADLMANHGVAGMKVKRAVENGAKLVILGGKDSLLSEIATAKAGLEALPQLAKALLENGKDIDGYSELSAYLAKTEVSAEVQEIADMYIKAKKAIIIFEKNSLTSDAARLVADIAVLSSHCCKPRDGIIQLLPGANSQGLADLGIANYEEYNRRLENGEIKGMFVFGEDVQGLDKLQFLAVQELHMTSTAAAANVVFPATSFAETCGSFTSADSKVQQLKKAVASPIDSSNLEQIMALSAQAGVPMGAIKLPEVKRELSIKLVAPQGDKLSKDEVKSTNALYVGLLEYAKSFGV